MVAELCQSRSQALPTMTRREGLSFPGRRKTRRSNHPLEWVAVRMKPSGHGSPQATPRSGNTIMRVRGSVTSVMRATRGSVRSSGLSRKRTDRSAANTRETDLARDRLLSTTRRPPLWPSQRHSVRARLPPALQHPARPTASMHSPRQSEDLEPTLLAYYLHKQLSK